jgi:lactate dehydrogenase-like 2-hydroxyacid dehydrogenase
MVGASALATMLPTAAIINTSRGGIIDEQSLVQALHDGTGWPSGGPFVLDEFDPFNDLRFERNNSNWKSIDGRALPYLDAVTILATTEPGS